MLTLNADDHPLMMRMHRPDPKRPPHMQDKRSVVPIELEDVDVWLYGTLAEASALIKLSELDAIDAEPLSRWAAQSSGGGYSRYSAVAACTGSTPRYSG